MKQDYKQTDIGLIPEDWNAVPIGEFLEFKNGLNKGKEFFGYGTPIVNYTDTYKKRALKRKDIEGRVSLSKEEIRRFEARQYDVFFTRTSETPDEVGLSSVLLDEIDDCVFSGFILRGRPKNNLLDPLYCKYCFSTKEVRRSIITGCTYTTRALTNGKQLSSIKILVPPLAEQKRIAEALSDVDELIASLEKLIEKKKALKQGVMQELLTGKRRLPGFTGEWKKRPLGKCGRLIKESINPQMYENKRFSEYSMPAFDAEKTPNLRYGGEMHSNRVVIDGEVLLYNKLNVRQKRIWYIENCSTDSICSSEFLPYCSAEINLKLLAQILQSDETTTYFIENSTGTSNSQKRITPTLFLEYEVLLPEDNAEQTTIANLLENFDMDILQIQKRKEKFCKLKYGMMSELLTGKIRLM